MDGIPESIAIGVSMIAGGVVSAATIIAIFLSNIPEGLSTMSGMKKNGRSAKYIFWCLVHHFTYFPEVLLFVAILFSKNFRRR